MISLSVYLIKSLLKFVAHSKPSHGFAATEILSKGHQNYIPFSANSSSLPVKNMIRLLSFHKVCFPKLNHVITSWLLGQALRVK